MARAVAVEEEAATVAARVLVAAVAMAVAEVVAAVAEAVVVVAEAVAAEVAPAEAAAAAATVARSAVVATQAAERAGVRRARRPTPDGSLLARPLRRWHSARDGHERKRNSARCHPVVRELEQAGPPRVKSVRGWRLQCCPLLPARTGCRPATV
eukprot:6635994-Prymnesium_polylepis.1